MSLSLRTCQVFALGGALLLSACSSPSQQDMYGGAVNKPAAPRVHNTPKPEKPKLSARRLAAIQEFKLEDGTPDKLIGLDGFDVEQALGKPDFIRKDSGVEIWQYRTDKCILDLFLYAGGGAHMQVSHTELRGHLPKTRAGIGCFRTIVMDIRS